MLYKAAEARPRVDDFGTSMEQDIRKTLGAAGKILQSTDEEFGSRQFILDRIREFGLLYCDWSLLARYSSWKNSSQFGLLQYPTEFADFVMELAKLGIKTSIEIGVFRGASSYFIAAMLQRANRDSRYAMLDMYDNIVAFDEFSKILTLEKLAPATSSDMLGKSYDFVFIDADHSFNGAQRDYLNVGRYCNKAVAFHDICAHEYDHQDGGTVRMWREFREANADTMRIMQFSHSPSPWMGLGLGIRVD